MNHTILAVPAIGQHVPQIHCSLFVDPMHFVRARPNERYWLANNEKEGRQTIGGGGCTGSESWSDLFTVQSGQKYLPPWQEILLGKTSPDRMGDGAANPTSC